MILSDDDDELMMMMNCQCSKKEFIMKADRPMRHATYFGLRSVWRNGDPQI